MARRVELQLRGRLKRLFANLGSKVLALVIAVLLWFFITSGREAYRELEVPLELYGVPEGVVVNGPLPEGVTVRAVGKGRDLIGLGADDFKVVLNLADKEPGVHRIDLTPADVIYTGNRDVKADRILGERILMLELERHVTKTVPVKVEFTGTPAAGYYLGVPEVEPARVTLYGSAPLLEKVRAVTVAADAEGRAEAFEADVPIRAPAGITLVGADAAAVSVAVARGERRTFEGVRVSVRRGKNARYDVSPPAVAITLEGEAGRLASLKAPAASIDPRGAGRYTVSVKVPDYVTLVSVAPAEVEAKPAAAP